MVPYLTVLTASVLCFYFAEKVEVASEKKWRSGLFVFLGILLPCLLAGFRDTGVGADTIGYGTPLFLLVEESRSFTHYLQLVEETQFDVNVLYSVVTYVITSLFHSRVAYYATIEALTLIPFYCSLRLICGSRKLWVGISLYYLLFYLLGLTILRQGIAISLIILSFALLYRRYWLLSISAYISAVLFHSSASVWVVINLLWIALFQSKTEDGWIPRKYFFLKIVIVGVCSCLLAFNIKPLFLLVTSVPGLDRYASYLNTDGPSNFLSVFVFFSIMLSGLICLLLGVKPKQKEIATFLLLVCFLTIPIDSMQSLNRQFVRLAYYSWAFYPLLLAFLASKLNTGNQDRRFIVIGSLAVLAGSLGEFIWVFVINNGAGAVPYTSALLGLI